MDYRARGRWSVLTLRPTGGPLSTVVLSHCLPPSLLLLLTASETICFCFCFIAGSETFETFMLLFVSPAPTVTLYALMLHRFNHSHWYSPVPESSGVDDTASAVDLHNGTRPTAMIKGDTHTNMQASLLLRDSFLTLAIEDTISGLIDHADFAIAHSI